MKFLLFFLTVSSYFFGGEPFFTHFEPPKGWLVSDPSKYEKGVKVAFIASKREIFTPSITLALEKIGEVDSKTYLEAVKKVHGRHKVDTLGTFQSKVGKGYLLQIDMENQWGEIRLLQAITLQDGYALIQTGASLKKDFLKVHEIFLASFKSLETYPSLLDSCSDPLFQKKTQELTRSFKKYRSTSKDTIPTLFKSPFFQNNQWKPFVKYIEKRLTSKGVCWQLLATRHVQESLLTENK